ncbi:MAG: class I SAM-dependent methyltransferase [Asgard group archaeon]|nr:class I SAM-dependent methyltransferase [Asgard group archaeon]
MNNDSKSNQCSDEETEALGIVTTFFLLKKDPETGETILNKDTKVKATQEGFETLTQLHFKNKLKNWEELLPNLTQKNLLLLEDELYSLTDEGRKIGKEIRSKWHSKWYDNILIRCTKSEAYGLFCEKVFGKNLIQFNASDMEQLDTMINYLQLQPDNLVLDMGCGLGKVAEYIVEKTGAKVVGIDFSEETINWAKEHIQAKNENLEFQLQNFNRLDFPPSTFDAIISIDTFYFVEDFDVMLKKLKQILQPGGQMGIFFAQIISENDPVELLEAENTKMAKALTQNNLEYKAIDFTINAKNLWQRELAAAEELKEMFEKEGNLVLYEDRIADSKNVIRCIENNLQRRFFYHIKLVN